MSAKILVDEKRIEVKPEVLSIYLDSELVERMDEVVDILGLDNKEDLVRCTISNMWADIEWIKEDIKVTGHRQNLVKVKK